MKLYWSLALLMSTPAFAFVPSLSSDSSTKLHLSSNPTFNNNNIGTNNGYQQPTPNFAPPFGRSFNNSNSNNNSNLPQNSNTAPTSSNLSKDSVFPRTNSEAPANSNNNNNNSSTEQSTNTQRTSYESDNSPQLIVNIHNGYVTMDRGRKRVYMSNPSAGSSLSTVSSLATVSSNNNNNGYRPPTSMQATAMTSYEPEKTQSNNNNNNNNFGYDGDPSFPPGSSGDVAVRALQDACDYVVALAEENESLKRDVRVLEESEEELLYEQERLEREVKLLQDQMIQLQNRYRTLSQEEEKLRGEYYLLLLEREATQIDYEEKLSMDTRLEQAELRLRQKGIYS